MERMSVKQTVGSLFYACNWTSFLALTFIAMEMFTVLFTRQVS